jgi:hypothetical protein
MTKIKADLKQVGVAEFANGFLSELVNDTDWFENEQDVYRVAVAIAISREMPISAELRGQEIRTKWRVTDDLSDPSTQGSRLDDPKGTLAQMVTAFCPEYATEPYRYSQYLASVGIGYLHGCLFDRGQSLHDALVQTSGPAVEEEASGEA